MEYCSAPERAMENFNSNLCYPAALCFDSPLAKRSEEATANAVPSADKKSSPEIVPASFSNAPSARNNPIPISSRQAQQVPSGIYALPSNDEILAAVAAAAQNSQQQLQEEPTALEEAVASSTMRKRGINYEYNPYSPLASSDYNSDVPSGVWSDDYEAAVPVSYGERDLQEIDDYVPERRGGLNLIIGTLNPLREYSDVLICVENVLKIKATF